MQHKCPICKSPTDSTKHPDFPFCSDDCRVRDLGNWATEKYVVSDLIFDEDDVAEADRKTLTLDLNNADNSNDAEH